MPQSAIGCTPGARWCQTRAREGEAISGPVSRILCPSGGLGRKAAAIFLGVASPRRSRGRPGSANEPGALLPILALLRAGLARPPRLRDAGALLPHHFTLTRSTRAVCFCCAFRRLAPPRRYLAPLPGGVRTFLNGARGPAAAARPADHHPPAYARDAPARYPPRSSASLARASARAFRARGTCPTVYGPTASSASTRAAKRGRSRGCFTR